ncbi:GNAT family N-acetyltransferase [Candidatus Bipolaricaulota bacterium]
MSSQQNAGRPIVPTDAPDTPGLEFRSFRGESDYEPMLAVIEASKAVDQDEWSQTLDDIVRNYRYLRNCDPFTDMIFAEVEGQVAGYGRTWWEDEKKGDRVYNLFTNMAPDWRGVGIRRAMLRWLETRACEVSDGNPTDGAELLQSWASENEHDAKGLLESEGYEIVRWEYEMVRSLADTIQPAPLPEGIEVRPVTDADADTIFAAAAEAFADHWGVTSWFDADSLKEWREGPTWNPALWKIAWDGDQVVGTVLNFVDEKENAEYERRRGYTEAICVLKPWRGLGVAKALITESMKMHKEMGMTETAHGVDTQNPTGALQLYEGLGYRPRKTHFTFRKPLRT